MKPLHSFLPGHHLLAVALLTFSLMPGASLITVAGAPLTITAKALPAATVGTGYSQTLTATGGTSPYTWALAAGGFPPGLTLSANGRITGTATASGSWIYTYPFRVYVSVKDAAGKTAAGAFTLSVVPPTGAPPPTPHYLLTVNYGSGGGSYAANTTVSIIANPAPAGQVFQGWTGATVADRLSPTTTLVMPAANASITATYASSTPLAITTGALTNATVAAAYSQTLIATGGKAPCTWTLLSGGFPDGLSLKSATGEISGTPTASGSWVYSYPFRVYIGVTDSAAHTAARAFTITVLPPPVTLYPLTVVNGSGGGSYAANTTVSITANPAPAGQFFQSWTGTAVANPLLPTTTLVMPAVNTTVTATYSPSTPDVTIPQPVKGHPRLWISAADLPRLTSWCVASNPIYQQGLLPLLKQAIADYDNQFFPGGQPNPNYPDLGDTQGYTGLLTEQDALIFALHSLIDPSPAARIQHAQRARNLVMVAMNLAAQGPLAGAPFRDPLFSVYNRANFTSEAWPLVVDWIYSAADANNQPILTAQDKATIRTVFLRWASECLNASTTGGDHPSPVGAANSPSLLGNGSGNAYRMASNNYYLGHARLLTLMSLAFDPADDPLLDPNTPASKLGNTLRSYILNATGAWLYQEFAMLGDPELVRSALGLSASASVGLASGGLPPEGMLYGHSYSFILGQLLAIKTAGFADPSLSGPQVALANNAPVWDRFVRGMITSLVPSAQVFPGYSYMGPVYQMASYGDILRLGSPRILPSPLPCSPCSTSRMAICPVSAPSAGL